MLKKGYFGVTWNKHIKLKYNTKPNHQSNVYS